MKTTLLIMAAGIGSRFGTGIKQLEPVDDAGHIIMDYSIHDAIEAGFNHVVFIIRKDIEKEFKEVIGDRIASICSSHNVTVDYAFQDINDIPGELPAGRTKPWGTGQAVLAAKNVIDTPFIVINADDYYGKEGFKDVHEYLVNGGKSCMAGFVLKNTLSDNGGVTRGICKMDENGNLTEVVETKNIVKTADGAEADGVVVDVNSLVSMNMWGLQLSRPSVTSYLPYEKGVYFPEEADASNISTGAERQRHYRAVVALRKDPCEENLWKCVVAFRGYKFKTMSGLSFTYTLKKGRGDEFTKELWIDRREDSKSLAWSSVRLAYHNIGKIGEVVDRPKALGDIRGVSYIYGMFYRFGLIEVPDKAKEKMGVKEH